MNCVSFTIDAEASILPPSFPQFSAFHEVQNSRDHSCNDLLGLSRKLTHVSTSIRGVQNKALEDEINLCQMNTGSTRVFQTGISCGRDCLVHLSGDNLELN